MSAVNDYSVFTQSMKRLFELLQITEQFTAQMRMNERSDIILNRKIHNKKINLVTMATEIAIESAKIKLEGSCTAQ